MNWLNKVDDALDWVLGPSSSSNDDGGNDDGRNSSDRQGDEDAIAAAAAASILREVEGMTNNPPHLRQSQPQPYHPTTPHIRTKPNASPPPATPLMAMAGEYLVLDESPYPSYKNSATTETTTMNNADGLSRMQYSPNNSLEPTKMTVHNAAAATNFSDVELHTQTQQHYENDNIDDANKGPSTPSTFVIQVPSTNQILLHQIVPPPPLMNEGQSNLSSTVIDRSSAIAATTAKTRTLSQRRTTPGVIRRRLREPSLSPPVSPTISLSDNIDIDANNDDVKNNDLGTNTGAKVLAPSFPSGSSTAATTATASVTRPVATATTAMTMRTTRPHRPTPGVIRRRLREPSPSPSLSDNSDMAAANNDNDEESATRVLAAAKAAIRTNQQRSPTPSVIRRRLRKPSPSRSESPTISLPEATISVAVAAAATTVAADEKPSTTIAATVSTTPRTQPQRPTPGIIRRRLREPSQSPPESPTMSLSDNSDIAADTMGNISVSRIETDTAAAQPITSTVPTTTRVPNRSTPGIIRRRLREPSPPESPTSSMSDNSINSGAKVVVARPTSVGLSTATTAISARPKAPGIIRRRLREPSPSPPESPSSSMSSSGDAVVPSLLSSTAEPGAVLEEISVGKEMEQVDENNVASNNDDNSISDDGSFHSESSNDSELTDSNLADDFAVPTSSEIQSQQQDEKIWDPSLNRYGFFHVRLLRAQRLSCSSGSFINATLTLHPWNGRIRIPARTSIVGPEGAGVCLRWDKPLADQKQSPRSKLGSGSKDHGPVDEKEASSHSMVHAYNNPDTPIPAIYLELRSSSLGGLIDRFICSITVPCQEHLRNPRNWQRKWYSAIDIDGSAIDSLVLLEACFEPEVTRLTASAISNQIILEEEVDINTSDHLINLSGDSENSGSVPLIIRPNRRGVLDDDSISKSSSTLTPALFHRSNTVTKSHLLRVRSFWTPTWCSVCASSIISGWIQGFECEACHIFCCRDCQLQVDVRIPCGSELSTIAVKKAQQYQVPSLGQIMTTLAPKLDVEHTANLFGSNTNPNQQNGQPSFNLMHEGKSMDGIGIMNVRILRACLFDKTFPPETEPNEVFDSDFNLRNGDHYVRISWLGSKESKRTKTVLQTSKPLFDSEEMIFDVPHYGMEYKLEVIDSNTDKPIGSYLLSAQSLLQWQRDDMFASMDKILLSFFHLRNFSEPRRVKLELRTGVKDGYGLNYYNSSTSTGDNTRTGKETTQRPGEISGWLEIDVHLEEDRRLFYSSNPRRISRPEEEFDTNMIQLHIARISAIVECLQQILSSYFYVVSWENQELTGASMILFVILTLRFNVEYLGAFPVGCLALYMIYLGYLRVDGHFKDRWCCQEKEALIKSESKIETNKSIFRPLGILQIGQLQGKHLRSNDLGLPGSFYATIMYDPLRYADEKTKSSIIKLDSSSGCIHQVGATISPGITSSPVWSQLHESPELMRLKYLLPNDRLFACDTEASLAYPILQPITDGRSIDEMIDGDRNTGISLMPWEQSYGAIVIQVRFSDVLGSFHMFDNNLGEVVIPLAKLAGSGRPVEGWFRLLDVGTTDTLPGEESYDIPGNSQTGNESFLDDIYEDGLRPAAATIEYPELYLNAKFTSKLFPTFDKYGDKESFKVVCEEMSRTASMAKENRIGVIGSSLSTINTIRTLGGTLQNQLSYLVDMLERARNAFNFSNPRISCFILLCLSILWIVLAWIPTRLVVLICGMAQFGATFYASKMSPHSSNNPSKGMSEEVVDLANGGNPFENLFLSIPTDEDLRRTYFWEARRVGEKERNKFANAKRLSRLEKLWKAKWYGTLALKVNKAEQSTTATTTTSSSRSWNWEHAFGLLEGHRFIWWASERHFDTGESSLGQIFFAGHSGLAGLSPLDLRELSTEEVPLVVSIFGRGPQGQHKLTILTPDIDAKEWLENAVLGASMDAKAD